MNPIRFASPRQGIAQAERVLATYLPNLDVQLFEYASETVLLPPHLMLALQLEYGPLGTAAIVAQAGLGPGRPEPWRRVIDWGLRNAGVWALRSWPQPALAAAAAAHDWHLELCRVQPAWAAVGGPEGIDWSDIRLGHIDTGYTRHPVFGFPAAPPWLDESAARTFIADPPPAGGQDPLSGASGGHGTTSGSIGCGFDSDARYYGVAPRLPVVMARINDCVIIDQRSREFEAAVRYLVDDAKVAVINVSMGTFLRFAAPAAMRRALDHCYERGVIVVAAAGNVPAPGWLAYPAALARAVAVAGVTRQGLPWAGSSYGSWVDFSAPARQVRRAQTTAAAGFGYTDAGIGGTTFAAAMTSGAAALWLRMHAKSIPHRYPEPWQRIEAFRAMARALAIRPEEWVPDRGFGAGILNVGGLADPADLPDAAQLDPH